MPGFLIDTGFWIGWNVLWLLPHSISVYLFDLIGRTAWRLRTRGVRQLELNLSRVFELHPSDPAIRKMSRQGMRNYMRYYCETFLLPKWDQQELSKRVRVENDESLRAALDSGGAILTLPHSGNWDLAGAWAAQELGSLCTVAERLRPEGVYQKFMKIRTDRNIQLMPLVGETGIYEWLRDHVNSGRLVALLGDRDVARNGMGTDFFAHRAALPIGAAMLAIDTQRPLFTCSTWFDKNQLVITFDEPIDVDSTPVSGKDRIRRACEITAQIAIRFEQHIKAHPTDWHMLQVVWSDLIADVKK